MFAREVAQPIMADTQEQREWRAQDDARTLAESEVIKADAKRLTDAKVAALKLAQEDEKKADAMMLVAKIRKSKTLAPKGEQKEGAEGGEAKKPKATPKPKNTFNVFSRI